MKKFLLTALAALAIALLTACSGNGQLSYIGDEAARTAALSGAGLSADSVTFTGTKLTNRDGVEYYLVSFTSGANQYQSQVDALSGVVIQTETQPLSQSAATAASGATITAEDAKAKALAHAGLTADAVTFVTAQLDRDDGRLVYDVEFYTADYKEYDYEIDAATGDVLSFDFDADHYAPAANQPPAASASITAEDAKAKALAHAGLSADAVTFVTAQLDRENGRLVYDVEFYTADYKEYDYEIDATTGEVVSYDYDAEHYAHTTTPAAPAQTPAPAAAATPAPAAQTPAPAAQAPAQAATGATISAEDAKAKALAHAGLDAGSVTFVKARLDWDDGRQVYDVEFYTADYKEYDYEIDAATGAVVSYDYDAEGYAPPAATSGTISADDAKAIALAQVPGASASDIWEFETDRDDGRIQYEGKIVYGGMEYEFEIDGYSGAIRNWEVEPAHH